MLQALSRAVVGGAQRVMQMAQALAPPQSWALDACDECCQALDQRTSMIGNLDHAFLQLDIIIHNDDCPLDVKTLAQQSYYMVMQVAYVQMNSIILSRAAGVFTNVCLSSLFKALLQAGCVAACHSQLYVGSSVPAERFTALFTGLSLAEESSVDDVEVVAYCVDVLITMRQSLPPGEGLRMLRRAAISIEDAVVLRCCCAVGHRCRASVEARLTLAFQRPIEGLMERLQNSYRKNVYSLEGAYSSRAVLQHRNLRNRRVRRTDNRRQSESES